jgi:hypothetical protein
MATRSFTSRFFIFTGLILLLMSLSCRKKDKVDSTPGLLLSFSTDTVYFDTVFATVGSLTKRLVVHNPNTGKVVISSIRLAGGNQSSYRINISGDPSISATDIEIPGNDSLYIFVRVTVNPNNLEAPFVVSDSIEFSTNGSLQNVKLVAWGQNANFYKYAKITGNVTWDSLKAHVIYGSLSVENDAKLTIMPGTKVYFHKGSYLDIQKGSTLKVNGSLEHPVRFQGDRLDPFYRDLPGQWSGIFLEQGSRDHEINYAVIKNGVTGVAADSLGSPSSPMLKLDNTIIQNMTSAGILAYGTSIVSTNCVIGNCGGRSIEIVAGGEYDFRQLTLGNYWISSVRSVPALYLSNYAYDTLGNKVSGQLAKAYFGNSIVSGGEESEIELDSLAGIPFNFTFDHALIKTKMNISNPARYINCIANQDPLFVDISLNDYRLDTLSPAIGKGIPMGVTFDIKGVDRGNTPDLGAYQYIKR